MAAGLAKAIETGIPEIDAAHKALFDLILRVGGDGGDGLGHVAIRDILREFHRLFTDLFIREEAVMEEMMYPKLLIHQEDHAAMISAIESLLGRLDKDGSGAGRAESFIVMIATGHIETMDMPLALSIWEQANRPRVAQRRGDAIGSAAVSAARPVARRDAPLQTPSPAKKSAADPYHNLQSIIRDSYTSTLLSLKLDKGMSGEIAKTTACKVVSDTVFRMFGKKIRPDTIAQLVTSR